MVTLKYAPRAAQSIVLEEIKLAVSQSKKNILLNMPTGGGKSFLAMMIADWYSREINTDAKFDIITGTNILQGQYSREFPFVKMLKGSENYFCPEYKTSCKLALEICNAPGKKCSYTCPYGKAVSDYVSADISLTNFHFFNIIKVHDVEKFKRAANVLIVDEAHTFEQVFCDFIGSHISTDLLERIGFDSDDVEVITDTLALINSIDAYIELMQNHIIPTVGHKKALLNKKLANLNSAANKDKISDELKVINEVLDSFNEFLRDYYVYPDKWVLENNAVDRNGNKVVNNASIDVTPTWGGTYLPEKIYSKYDLVILMSATLLSKEITCFTNGLNPDDSHYIDMPSTFPIENNKVIYMSGIGKMTYNEKTATIKKQLAAIPYILENHKTEKGIIHTSNYEIQNQIKYGVLNSRLLIPSTRDRNKMLDTHTSSDDPTVLVSPSLNVGVDLKDDLSRWQVICKVPYPNIQSTRIKRRQEENPSWYIWATITDIVQTMGRSIRSETDHATTYILDSSFSQIVNNKMFPAHLKQSITFI